MNLQAHRKYVVALFAYARGVMLPLSNDAATAGIGIVLRRNCLR